MKLSMMTGVGQAVFDVNRDGEDVVITIDSRLSQEQIKASVQISLGEKERFDFCNLTHFEDDSFSAENLGISLATVALKS